MQLRNVKVGGVYDYHHVVLDDFIVKCKEGSEILWQW